MQLLACYDLFLQNVKERPSKNTTYQMTVMHPEEIWDNFFRQKSSLLSLRKI